MGPKKRKKIIKSSIPPPCCICKVAPPPEFKENASRMWKNDNNKCIISHYLLSCQYRAALGKKKTKKNTPLRAKHAKREVDVPPWPLSKTQRGQSSEVGACLRALTSLSGTCLVRLCLGGLWFPWPDIHLNILLWLRAAALTSLPSCTPSPGAALKSCYV